MEDINNVQAEQEQTEKEAQQAAIKNAIAYFSDLAEKMADDPGFYLLDKSIEALWTLKTFSWPDYARVENGLRKAKANLNHLRTRMNEALAQNEKKAPDQGDFAAKLAEQAGDNLGYDEESDTWRMWNDTHWPLVDRNSTGMYGLAINAIEECGGPINDYNVKGTITLARGRLKRAFTPRPNLINFKNGTFDVKTGSLKPHDKADELFYCIDYYAIETNGGDCPEIDSFLNETIPDREARQAYMEHLGLALIGDLTVHKALLLVGPMRAGKGTLLALANYIVGQRDLGFAAKDIFSRELEGKRERYDWADRPLAPVDEFPAEVRANEEEFKMCTAHSWVNTRPMGGRPVPKRWRAKIILATNDMPRFSDPSGAAAYRLMIIRCPNSKLGQENLTLFEKLIPEAGVFAFKCIEAAKELLARGRYSENSRMAKDLSEMSIDGDPIKSFASECCVLSVQDNKTHRISSRELYEQYVIWVRLNGHKQASNKTVTSTLTSYSPWKISRTHTKVGTVLEGINLKGRFKFVEHLDKDGKTTGTGHFGWEDSFIANEDAVKDEGEETTPVTDVTDGDTFKNNLSPENILSVSSKNTMVTDVTDYNEKNLIGGDMSVSIEGEQVDIYPLYRGDKTSKNVSHLSPDEFLPFGKPKNEVTDLKTICHKPSPVPASSHFLTDNLSRSLRYKAFELLRAQTLEEIKTHIPHATGQDKSIFEQLAALRREDLLKHIPKKPEEVKP